jgi:hypothetical protein
MVADKLADKAMKLQDIPKMTFNKYQNEFVLQNSRRKEGRKERVLVAYICRA